MSKRILVIDDEEAVRKSFRLALEDTDYQLDAAECGEAGLRLVDENHYDLVFLDLKMPGLNGVETMKEIRKKDDHVPIYIVTAFHAEFMAQLKDAQQQGVHFEVVRKPIGADQIMLLSQSILE